jgi:hypothetical protein
MAVNRQFRNCIAKSKPEKRSYTGDELEECADYGGLLFRLAFERVSEHLEVWEGGDEGGRVACVRSSGADGRTRRVSSRIGMWRRPYGTGCLGL